MVAEWYLSPDWDEQAQADFRLRLSHERDRRVFYLGQKAAAIADEHPEDALALYDQKIAAAEYEDEIVPALHAQAMIHFRAGDYEAMFSAFERAIEVGGEFTAIAAITDYCSAVGLLRDETRYDTALAWLDKLDTRAMTQLGSLSWDLRPARRAPSFAGKPAIANWPRMPRAMHWKCRSATIPCPACPA